MGEHVDLLRSLPKTRRNVAGRKADKSPEVIAIAKQYGREYFDGDRKYGYGGYKYDGRWKKVAQDIIGHYGFDDKAGYKTVAYKKYGMSPSILDVGCAKGFLVHDLFEDGFCDPFGIDISRYAIVEAAHPKMSGRLHLGSADDLPFPDKSFDLVLSINTLHNLPRPRLIKALQEIKRVSRGSMFVQVDSYLNDAQLRLFEDWVLTAEWHGDPGAWIDLFNEAGYDGDYGWTVVEEGE